MVGKSPSSIVNRGRSPFRLEPNATNSNFVGQCMTILTWAPAFWNLEAENLSTRYVNHFGTAGAFWAFRSVLRWYTVHSLSLIGRNDANLKWQKCKVWHSWWLASSSMVFGCLWHPLQRRLARGQEPSAVPFLPGRCQRRGVPAQGAKRGWISGSKIHFCKGRSMMVEKGVMLVWLVIFGNGK